VRPDAIVANLLDGQDESASARNWKKLMTERADPPPARPAAVAVPLPAQPIKESRNPFKRKAKKLPVENADTLNAVEQETLANPVYPPAMPKVESVAPAPELEPVVEAPPVSEKIDIVPPPATSARDLAEQEIVDLIIRAQRVSKSTGAPLEVCLEELRRHLSKPVVAEATPKQPRNRRIEFETSATGLLTGAKVIEE
jgi:hypothetical protein